MRCTGCSSSSTSQPGRTRRRDRAELVSGGHRRGGRAHLRVRRLVLRVGARRPRRDPRGRAAGAAVRVRARRRARCTDASTCSGATARARSCSTTRRTRSPRAPEEIVEADYRLQRLVYALACFRAGADEVEVVYHFLERPDAVVSTTFERDRAPRARVRAVRRDRADRAGEFVPTPSEFTCSGCPALDLVCAGPRLGGARGGRRTRRSRSPDPRRTDTVVVCHAATSPRRGGRGCAEEGRDPSGDRAAGGRARRREDRAHVREPARAPRSR